MNTLFLLLTNVRVYTLYTVTNVYFIFVHFSWRAALLDRPYRMVRIIRKQLNTPESTAVVQKIKNCMTVYERGPQTVPGLL